MDYAGQSRQFVQESGGFLVTLLFALIIVFLALAAQFESFRDPTVILVSVPMALFGALMFINIGSRHAQHLHPGGAGDAAGADQQARHPDRAVRQRAAARRALPSCEAIEEAAAVRLRPILMTTAAMVLGVVPLVIASGAGAAGRRAMGLVIFTGLSIGTLFTLFVVPAMYILIGADHGHEHKLDDPGKDTTIAAT